ncbi:MAG: hypothetical protein GX345_08065 [Clostridiales bacterium]|nr:hypothetical protein [Clostridiales bacterium]
MCNRKSVRHSRADFLLALKIKARPKPCQAGLLTFGYAALLMPVFALISSVLIGFTDYKEKV